MGPNSHSKNNLWAIRGVSFRENGGRKPVNGDWKPENGDLKAVSSVRKAVSGDFLFHLEPCWTSLEGPSGSQ